MWMLCAALGCCAVLLSPTDGRAQAPPPNSGPAYGQTPAYSQLPAYPQTGAQAYSQPGVYEPGPIAPVAGPVFTPPPAGPVAPTNDLQPQSPAGDAGANTAFNSNTVPLPGASLPGAVDLAPAHVFTSAQIIARVGNETILASDVLPQADEYLQGQIAKMSAEQSAQITADEYEKQRWFIAKKLLESFVETKLMYADALNAIPKENHARIKQDLMEKFEKTQMKTLMDKNKVATRGELEKKLVESGQSLERQRQFFLERAMAGSWLYQHTRENKEIPVSQILGYYQEHIADYEFPSKARWEQMSASFDQHTSKAAAFQAAAEMGNDVLRGVSFADVAKKRSNGPTAATGGERDWTTKGSLKSSVLDEALFGLPVGRMSPILEDETGFHIIRVVERVDAGRKPFLEAQIEIRKKLKEDNQKRQETEFVAKVKQRTPVWTVFDDPSVTIPGAQQSLVGRPAEAERR